MVVSLKKDVPQLQDYGMSFFTSSQALYASNSKYQYHFVFTSLMLLQYEWFTLFSSPTTHGSLQCFHVHEYDVPLLEMSPSSSSLIHKTALSLFTYIPVQELHIHQLNRPRLLQLLATVAMCNIVELHLSLALQTRMTNPSRSALKALGEASGAARRPL